VVVSYNIYRKQVDKYCMPRLSLYRPHKSDDYEFLDRIIYEQFSVGGTDMNLHKYLGPKNPQAGEATADQPEYDVIKETNIQDLLFLENRDRKYDQDIYTIRCVYNIQDNDFNLSQFGLFLSNDTIFVTVHINSSVKTIGRKILSGDVIELPHLKDEYALNDYNSALKRYYVIEEVTRPTEGFSQTWYPHLYRLKLKQIVDSQEYSDILDLPAEEGSENTLRDLLSTFETEMNINNAVVSQAESDAPKSGYDTTHYYTLAVDERGKPAIIKTEAGDEMPQTPVREGYSGYLMGDGIAPNGEAFGFGTFFPSTLDPQAGDYFLRTDFMPNRLFRYDGRRWIKVEDAVRMTMTNGADRQTQKGTFINNTNITDVCGDETPERQSLSKALRPRADN
jgi:hypothetical protein